MKMYEGEKFLFPFHSVALFHAVFAKVFIILSPSQRSDSRDESLTCTSISIIGCQIQVTIQNIRNN